MTLTLHGGTVIDGTGAEPQQGEVVAIGDRIAAVGVTGSSADPSTTIDVSGLTVLPGLVDLHTHMGLVETGEPDSTPAAILAAHLFRNAELCLHSGHTTAREVAGADGGLKKAIELELVPGPRLFPSGPLLCQSGGHGDVTPPFFSDHHHHNPGVPGLTQGSVVCDGPEGVRIAARNAFRRGATQIKVCVSGGVVSLTDRLEDTQFTVEELRAAVDEARARETYVTAHAHNVRSILNGLEAGIECFEHGTFLDEPTAARMAAAGAALVPTLTVIEVMATRWQEWGVPEETLPRLNGVRDGMMASIKIAHDAGVTIGSGTDLLGPGQAERGMEIALKARVLGPMEAIVSATTTSAKILRRPDIGRLAPGALADVIAVDFDPLSDPELWVDPQHVVLVVKDGVVVKDTRG
jgi:imidazolonepropionase-like amidohydrolase